MPRKASTEPVRIRTSQKKSPAFWAGLLVAGFVIVGGAVLLGRSDSGQIDVSKAIQNSNQARQEAGESVDTNVQAIPEAFRNKTNGGLVPQESQPESVPEVVPVDTAEATSTDTEITDEETNDSNAEVDGNAEVVTE